MDEQPSSKSNHSNEYTIPPTDGQENLYRINSQQPDQGEQFRRYKGDKARRDQIAVLWQGKLRIWSVLQQSGHPLWTGLQFAEVLTREFKEVLHGAILKAAQPKDVPEGTRGFGSRLMNEIEKAGEAQRK